MAGLSVLIPVYNQPVESLVASLLAQAGAWPGPVEVLLLDDGSDEENRRRNRPLAARPGVRYEELPANVGRAAARNALAARARHEWLLLLDNDSRLPDGQFLARYAAAVAAVPPAAGALLATSVPPAAAGMSPASSPPAVLIGGTAYEVAPPADPALRLRWLYGRAREMQPAAVRRRWPPGQLTINNALLRREVLRRLPFDETLRGYGHEDTLLGLALARAGVPVTHLDNPVLHEGLEPAAAFLAKSQQAVRNLVAATRAGHPPPDTRLTRAAARLRHLGLAAAALVALAALEPALRRHLLSARPRLQALDLLKLRWLLAEQ